MGLGEGPKFHAELKEQTEVQEVCPFKAIYIPKHLEEYTLLRDLLCYLGISFLFQNNIFVEPLIEISVLVIIYCLPSPSTYPSSTLAV